MSTPFYTEVPAPVNNTTWGQYTIKLLGLVDSLLCRLVNARNADKFTEAFVTWDKSRPAADTEATIEALLAVCPEGCDWLSSGYHGEQGEIDLSKVCGGK